MFWTRWKSDETSRAQLRRGERDRAAPAGGAGPRAANGRRRGGHGERLLADVSGHFPDLLSSEQRKSWNPKWKEPGTVQ